MVVRGVGVQNAEREMNRVKYRESDGSFELNLPDGWELERDEEGGILISREDGCGILHVMPFERELGEETDPAEELYAFLEDQEIELQEDEVEDIDLAATGLGAVCEYLAEEGDELVHWLVCVATGPGQLLFASYSCPAEDEEGEAEIERIRDVLGSLRFQELPAPGG
jgi:hypothetical protein